MHLRPFEKWNEKQSTKQRHDHRRKKKKEKKKPSQLLDAKVQAKKNLTYPIKRIFDNAQRKWSRMAKRNSII
jgi:hypothetical protein